MDSDRFAAAALKEIDRLYSAARRLCFNPEEAEDLVQEVYAQAFHRRGTLRDPSRMGVWLHRILHGKFVDHLRRKQHAPQIVPLENEEDYDRLPRLTEEPTWNPNFYDQILPEEVEKALEKLTPDQRETLVLREVSELSYEEISEATSAPIGTVRSRLARARKRMQVELLDYAIRRGLVRREETRDGTS